MYSKIIFTDPCASALSAQSVFQFILSAVNIYGNLGIILFTLPLPAAQYHHPHQMWYLSRPYRVFSPVH